MQSVLTNISNKAVNLLTIAAVSFTLIGVAEADTTDRQPRRPPPSSRPPAARPPQRPPSTRPPVARPPQRPPVHRPPSYRPPSHRPPPWRPAPRRPLPPPYWHRPPYRFPVYRPPIHRPGWDYYRIETLTAQLENETDNVYRLARAEAENANSAHKDYAVQKLYDLAVSADRLRNSIRLYPRAPSYSSAEFRQVKNDFNEAREAVYWGDFSNYVDSEVNDVENLVINLDFYFW